MRYYEIKCSELEADLFGVFLVIDLKTVILEIAVPEHWAVCRGAINTATHTSRKYIHDCRCTVQ